MCLEYFEFQFKECPYCKSKKRSIEEWAHFGAHCHAIFKCEDCGKKWSTSDDTETDWQIPEKGE